MFLNVNWITEIYISLFKRFLLRKTWENDFVISIYRPPSQNSEFFINSLTNAIDHFTEIFDIYTIIVDFNLEPSSTILNHFVESNGLHDLIKGYTCFKGKDSLIDFILAKRKFSFEKNSIVWNWSYWSSSHGLHYARNNFLEIWTETIDLQRFTIDHPF